MGYASITDLEARWRALNGDQRKLAVTLLEDASLQLRREVPSLQAAVEAGDIDLLLVAKRVICGMVKRALSVGDDAYGVTSTQESQGPFSRSFNYSNPMGDLYVTRAERRLLGGGRQEAFSIDTAPPAPPAWWEVLP